MKVLVTGRDGQLARSLNELGNDHPQLELLFVGRPDTDLSIPGSVAAAIAASRPDVVINAAAYTDVDRAEDEPELACRINSEAAGEAARAAADIGVPIIQLSTDYVFDGRKDEPYVETDPTNPINVYGASKAAGEEVVRSANSRHLILRTSWVVSPFGRNFVKTMIGAARSRDVLTVVDDQYACPTSALDLADGLIRMVESWRDAPHRGLRETYHLAGTGVTSWCGFARAIMACCARFGLPAADVRPIATADWPTRAARPRNSAMTSAKFARDFGFVMPPWEQSLGEVVARLAEDR